jgi:hypothetical protein
VELGPPNELFYGRFYMLHELPKHFSFLMLPKEFHVKLSFCVLMLITLLALNYGLHLRA